MFSTSTCLAQSSLDVPVGSNIYNELERLEIKGLITSAMLATKPINRIEGAMLVNEAKQNWDLLPENKKESLKNAFEIIGRLEEEFTNELEPNRPTFFIKPIEGVYSNFFYIDKSPYFLNINNKGDTLSRGLNLRTGFNTELGLFNIISIYLNPEYRFDIKNERLVLKEGYFKISLYGAELLFGRESMWWGPSFNGSLLLTDNAKAFDMVRLTSSHPFVMPWVLKYLGVIKPTVFLTRLEENRDLSRANLLGMRLDFKPTPNFSFGLSRVFLFGGRGKRSLSASDWLKVFFVTDSAEHSKSPINGDQIASLNASYVYINTRRLIPFSGIKVYTEWGAEDSSGKSKTPTAKADIWGAFIDEPLWLDNVDFRLEWSNTARNAQWGPSWYHHYVYTTGYTYEGRIIGHHMGADSQELFARVQYHNFHGIDIGAEFNRLRSDIHSLNTRKEWYATDINYIFNKKMMASGGIGIEKNQIGSINVASWMKLNWLF